MPGRIKGLDGSSVSAAGGGLAETVRPDNAASSSSSTSSDSASSGPASDNVHITEPARALASLSQAVQQAPDVDAARVATIQQALSSGQYVVDPDRIAGRMLQLEQDLQGNPQ